MKMLYMIYFIIFGSFYETENKLNKEILIQIIVVRRKLLQTDMFLIFIL